MSNMHLATFGGGCFWCIDAAFRRVKGVEAVRSGYTGGHIQNPTYQSICQGDTGHAEVVELKFDAAQISYETLLKMFFALHDPTQLNRQGNDIGTQYRSVIYFHDNEQQQLANDIIKQVQPHYTENIVTELSPAELFYPAESYHQDYFSENPNQGYCSVLIAPKIAKFAHTFSEWINE